MSDVLDPAALVAPEREGRGHRSKWIWAYIVPIAIAILASQTWFRPGTVVAGGDNPPPFAPDRAYRSLWNHMSNGEGSPSFQVVSLPEYESRRLLARTGIGAHGFQRLWFGFLFAGLAAAVVFFCFALRLSPLAAGAAGLLATFNLYWISTGVNHVQIAATAESCLLGGLMLLGAKPDGHRPSPWLFGLASVGLGYAFLNPAYVLIIALWLGCAWILSWPLYGWDGLRRSTRFIGRSMPWLLVANAWWLAPAILTITAPEFADRFPQVSITDWEWTHRRSSLANALTLNTVWSWDFPEFFPDASKYTRVPLSLFRYFLPVLALCGVLAMLIKRMAMIWVMLPVLAMATWIAKGLHPPGEAFNLWAYRHIPGFWLFSEPTKILALSVLVYAVLGGIGVRELFVIRQPRLQGFTRLVAAVLMIGALATSYPLIVGTVFPDDRPLLPPSHVKVNDDWHRVAKFVNASPLDGKVLVLPTADFYQMPTKWGYYGMPFTRFIIHRPVLEPLPGGYFGPQGSVEALIRSIESDLLADIPTEAVTPRLRALGVAQILLRRDLDSSFPGRTFANPRLLTRGLEAAGGIRRALKTETLDIYQVDNGSPWIYSAQPLKLSASSDVIAKVIGIVPAASATYSSSSRRTQTPENAIASPGGTLRVVRLETARVWRLRASWSASGFRIQLIDPLRVSVGGREMRQLDPMTIDFAGARPPLVVEAGTGTFAIERRFTGSRDLDLVRFANEAEIRLLGLQGSLKPDLTEPPPVGDCNRHDSRSLEQAGIRLRRILHGDVDAMELEARAHAACVSFDLNPHPNTRAVSVRFRYRSIRGQPPRFCLWSQERKSCVLAQTLPSAKDWRSFETLSRLPEDAGKLSLALYADADRQPITTVGYAGIRMELFSMVSRRETRSVAPAEIGTLSFSEGKVPVTVNPLYPSYALGTLENPEIGDCNKFDERSLSQVGIGGGSSARNGETTLELRARAHSACVGLRLKPYHASAQYRVRLEYQSLSGNRARICLWQTGVDRCKPGLVLPDKRGDWHTFDQTVDLDPGTTGLILTLYADGPARVRYKGIQVDPIAPLRLAAIPTNSDPTGLPSLSYRRLSPSRFEVQLGESQGPFLLVLSEAYAQGWRLEFRADVNAKLATHVVVNGYANGWLIEGDGDAIVTISYAPARLVEFAQVLSLIGLALIVAALGLRFLLRVRGRRVRRTSQGAELR